MTDTSYRIMKPYFLVRGKYKLTHSSSCGSEPEVFCGSPPGTRFHVLDLASLTASTKMSDPVLLLKGILLLALFWVLFLFGSTLTHLFRARSRHTQNPAPETACGTSHKPVQKYPPTRGYNVESTYPERVSAGYKPRQQHTPAGLAELRDLTPESR